MAQGVLKLSAAEVNGMANKFSDISEQTKFGLSQLNASLSDAFQVWKGMAATKFADEFNKSEQDMLNMCKELLETNKKLSDAANVLSAKDDAAANQAQQTMSQGQKITI